MLIIQYADLIWFSRGTEKRQGRIVTGIKNKEKLIDYHYFSM